MRLRGWIPRGRHARRQLLAAALAVLALLCAAGSAQAYVYWTEPTAGAIGRANVDGTRVDNRFIRGASSPVWLALDNAHIYWTNSASGTIGRANLDGTGVNQRFITGANHPIGVAVEGAHIYWTNSTSGGGSIGRASLDGTGVNQRFITGANHPIGVAVHGAYIYWTDAYTSATIGRASLNGTGVNNDFIAGASIPEGVVVEGAHIYWANNGVGSIGRASLDGSHVAQSFIAPASDPLGLALEGAHIYWTWGDSIGRASLDGTGANQSFITGLASPDSVAVDALGPTGPPPTQPVKAGVYINCQNRREVNGSLTQTLIPLQHPRTCVIYGQPESISTLYPLVRAHWKGWGNATATVNAIWDNPSPREGPPSPIRAKAFRIRSGCDGRRFYTRVSVPGFRHTTIVLDLSAACTLPPL
jgi:virginiamycin B lyase